MPNQINKSYGLLSQPRRGEMRALPENTGLLGSLADWIQDPMRPERGLLMGGLGDWARKVERGQETSYGDRVLASLDMIPGVDDLAVKGGLLAAGKAGVMAAPMAIGMSKALPSALPMDEASRMGRAKDGGFSFSGFHGSGDDISDVNRPLWLSETPDLANEYASMRYNLEDKPANVMPVVANPGKMLDADKIDKTSTVGGFANEMLQQAEANGVDVDMAKARELLNRIKKGAREEGSGPHYSRQDFWYYPSEKFGGDGKAALDEPFQMTGFDSIGMTEHGSKTLGVLTPENVRSQFATFDPEKKDSTNLLAQLSGAGLLGGGLGAGLLYNGEPTY